MAWSASTDGNLTRALQRPGLRYRSAQQLNASLQTHGKLERRIPRQAGTGCLGYR